MKDFFEDLGKRLGETAETVTNKAGEAIEIQRLKGKVRRLARENAVDLMEMGRMIYDSYTAGGEVSEEAEPLCRAISSREAGMKKYNKKIAELERRVSAKEQEKKQKGITKTKGFRYPPILSVVFYDGPGNWTAETSFRERVYLNDILGEYIPDFHYIVVPLSKYTNQQLVDKGDELSLIMLVDKLRSAADFRNLSGLPEEYFENISQNSPESVLKLIGKIISVLLLRMNVPKDEVADFTDRIERRDFSMLFENFEAYDVQETRRISKEEGKAEGMAEGILKLLEDMGPVTEEVRKKILAESDLEILAKWLKKAAKAESIEQFESCIAETDR